MDDLLVKLRTLRTGCFVGDCAVNVLAYADDIVLLSPTRRGLQTLVDQCELFAISRDIRFNVAKTVCMVFSPRKLYKASHLITPRSQKSHCVTRIWNGWVNWNTLAILYPMTYVMCPIFEGKSVQCIIWAICFMQSSGMLMRTYLYHYLSHTVRTCMDVNYGMLIPISDLSVKCM